MSSAKVAAVVLGLLVASIPQARADGGTGVLAVSEPASQTIAMPAIADRRVGDADLDPGASADSGLPVTYTTAPGWPPEDDPPPPPPPRKICELVEGSVRLYGTGACEVNAHQEGDADHLPAPTVARRFRIFPTGRASGVGAGGYHTCAVTSAGGVECWGANGSGFPPGGQVGDGTITDRYTPVPVSGLGSGVAAVGAGDRHSCAVTTSGGVKCWGYNVHGQLGIGGGDFATTPQQVVGLTSGVEAISGGLFHTCALTSAGGVKCWGGNGSGQLGDGTLEERATPVDVLGLTSGVEAISTGDSHTCAVTASGGVKCWGSNGSGQLGDGTTTRREQPVDVSGLSSGVVGVAAGGLHTCALLSTGGVKCWGGNTFGQLGNGQASGTSTRSLTAVDATGLGGGVTGIAAGSAHSCAVTAAGAVRCWGQNVYGQTGKSPVGSQGVTTPADVLGLSGGAVAVSAGSGHSCGVLAGGGIDCWGRNDFGQLGDGMPNGALVPVDASGLASGTSGISAGDATCAVTSAGGAKCWGKNSTGTVGDGTLDDRTAPVDVSGLSSGVAQIAAGIWHACALTTSGGAKCWGQNAEGAVGDGTTDGDNISPTRSARVTPVDVVGLASGVAEIAVGDFHTCAVVSGGATCWGDNFFGTVGDGTWEDRPAPTDVTGLTSGVAAVSAGGRHTCALTSAGGVKCWGRNDAGQLGDGTTDDRAAPVDVSGLGGVGAISAGESHTCALTTSGGVKCWGSNGSGQLGDRTTTDSSVPVDVVGLTSGVEAISAGGSHTCALTTGGVASCWGNNQDGRLGDGTTTDRTTPGEVSGLPSGVLEISAASHTCVRTAGGGVKCWGWNWDGQLGDGSMAHRRPVPVRAYAAFPATAQSIDFPAIADRAADDPDFDPGAAASSGLPVIYTASPAARCVIDDGLVRMLTGGTCEVTAHQPGDATYGAAVPVTRAFEIAGPVEPLPQSIDFPVLADRPLSDPAFDPGATATSGLEVTYSATPSDRCAIVGGLVELLSTGACSITAHQAGNSEYAAAESVMRTFHILSDGDPPPTFQPDAMISLSRNRGFVKNDLYNTTGREQTRTARVPRGRSKTFFLRVQNDGDVIDSFTVAGCAGGRGFSVSYRAGARGAVNITTKVVRGTYRLANVGVDAFKALRLVIGVGSRVGVGRVFSCKVTATSVGGPMQDAVKAKVTARK